MVNNTSIIFNNVPRVFPVKGDHMMIQFSEINLENPIPEGSILVKTLCLSVDAHMRLRMRAASSKSYIPVFTLNQAMDGTVVGKILQSKNAKFKVDDIVYGLLPFSEYSIIPEEYANTLAVRNDIKSSGLPLTYYVGALGMPGMTAYVGLIKFGKPVKGETLYVSAASGGVGQLVGQIGKLLGLYVVGSAGSKAKVNYLKEIGFDAAYNYNTEEPELALGRLCPKGIDIYFDNVGGKMMEAVVNHANKHARIVCCGMISQYEYDYGFALGNLLVIIEKSLEIRGFNIADSPEMLEPFTKEVTQWFKEGKLKYRETIAEGIEATPKALIDVLRGNNFGKQVVKVADL